VRRREFVTAIGGAAAWPLVAWAQQLKLPTIGFLGTSTAAGFSGWVAAFTKRLGDLGWIDGRTVVIEYRWAEGRTEHYTEIASEFVRLKVDVIVSVGGGALAAKQITSVVPIVFAVAADPLGSGLVESLARPGGNVTGLSVQSTDVAGKRLQILRELVPGLRRIGKMANVGYAASALEMGEVQAVASTLGLDTTRIEIRRPEDIAPAFDTLQGQADAIYVCADSLVNAYRIRINILALGARLPTMHAEREYVEPGGLVSYGPVYVELWRCAVDYVDKILRGAKPGDLPFQQPTKYELMINRTAAKALGLELSPALLAIADEVIE
jgi:putative ABC transport system substrate-binding protein